MYPFECRVPKNSKERQESLPQQSMERNRGNQQKGKDQRSLQGIASRDRFKGTFHAKVSTIKDRNGIDLTEAEDIKRWQEYIEELYKKRSS